jgi:hypothetical protein
MTCRIKKTFPGVLFVTIFFDYENENKLKTGLFVFIRSL